MSEQQKQPTKQIKERETGVFLILYKDSNGALAVVERGTKREASKTLDAIGFENVVAFYKRAVKGKLKIKQVIEMG